MNTINIPGFTAEASMYKTNGQYHAANQPEHASGIVRPAFGHAIPFSPFLPKSPYRPVSPWHKYVFEPFCREERKKYLDLDAGRWIELCFKVCSDGSITPIRC